MPTKVGNREVRLSLWIITLALVLAIHQAQAYGQPTPTPSRTPSLSPSPTPTPSPSPSPSPLPMLFGDVTIDRNFSPDPLIVRGVSGGSISGRELAGKLETPTGPCVGYFDEQANHTLELTAKFNYLKLLVDSPDDTTLIVKGPGGTWCNDDFEGKNPGIVGEWLPGFYSIWIGSFKKERYVPYSLKITQDK
jgi:hypothetical protein